MNRTVRSLIFWTFIVFFLIAAPVSVLYTAGYRYNAKNGSLVRTGVISITSAPRNVGIFLDGRDLERSTPFIVKYVLPGKYHLLLSKSGYHDWQGDVEVKSGETTNVHGAFLYLDADPTEQFIKPVSALSPSPNGALAAYLIQEGGWEEVWLFDTKKSTPWMIDRYSAEDDMSAEVVWSADSSRLFVRHLSTNSLHLYQNSGAPLVIDSELSDGATNIFWHPSDGSILYLAAENELRLHDFETNETTVFEDDAAASVLIDASSLTFIDNGSNVELYQTIGTDRELIALLPRADYTIAERDDSYIILRDKRSELVLLDIRANQPILLETSAHVYDWLPESDKLVWSDGNEVSLYTTPTHTVEFITRQSDFIESIAWHPSGASILIGTQTNMSAIEATKILETRIITSLMTVQNIETFWITADGKTAFFYGTVEGAGGLYSIELTR